MVSRKISLPAPCSVVGTVHSQQCLQIARRLKPGAVDFLEIRLDSFVPEAKMLRELNFPLILTVRHRPEGGAKQFSSTERNELFAQFMAHAAFVDVELRSLRALHATVEAARIRRVGIILSYHDFKRTPSLQRLRVKLRQAREAGADVFKIATAVDKPADLLPLLLLLRQKTCPLLSVMGMGPLGKVSRLLFAVSGSVLTYGFLGRAQVAGQWPAELLKQRISEIR